MRSGKTALTCAKISLLQLFSNPNCILILAVMTIFSFYIYSPMCRISQLSDLCAAVAISILSFVVSDASCTLRTVPAFVCRYGRN